SSSNRHPALARCLSMILSENRYPLFGIMLQFVAAVPRQSRSSRALNDLCCRRGFPGDGSPPGPDRFDPSGRDIPAARRSVVSAPKPRDIEALCAAKGMRMTEQRRVIARVL